LFFLISVKKTHCAYIVGSVWRHKDFKAQREKHVATRLPRL